MYEEAARSLFGPLAFNCMAPDDGNMNLLAKVGTPAQKERWLRPIVDGKVNSSFAMTEPAPGGGSDPAMIKTKAERKGDKWVIHGRKWFITGAGSPRISSVARPDDPRRGLTAFYHRDQPGWNIVRRIEIMGPEEHGGHCELSFDGLEISDENVLMKVGDGLRATQTASGRRGHPLQLARLVEALPGDRQSTSAGAGFRHQARRPRKRAIKLGQVAQRDPIGRLLTGMRGLKLDQGDRARRRSPWPRCTS
jgi:acyl-CoA dehydrogenase